MCDRIYELGLYNKLRNRPRPTQIGIPNSESAETNEEPVGMRQQIEKTDIDRFGIGSNPLIDRLKKLLLFFIYYVLKMTLFYLSLNETTSF